MVTCAPDNACGRVPNVSAVRFGLRRSVAVAAADPLSLCESLLLCLSAGIALRQIETSDLISLPLTLQYSSLANARSNSGLV